MRTTNSLLGALALLMAATCAHADPSDKMDSGAACTPPETDDPDTYICEGGSCSVAPGTHWMRTSAEHKAALRQIYHLAGLRAVQIGHERPRDSWVVVMDADETILDNSAYNFEREKCGRPYSRTSWSDWSSQQDAGLVPGAKQFIDLVYQVGGRVVVVTNRLRREHDWTVANLQKHGVRVEMIFYRGNEEGATKEKEARFEAVPEAMARKGFEDVEVVMYIGDQIGDFPEATQALREDTTGAIGKFGVDYFALPNPMYGGWMGNEQE